MVSFIPVSLSPPFHLITVQFNARYQKLVIIMLIILQKTLLFTIDSWSVNGKYFDRKLLKEDVYLFQKSFFFSCYHLKKKPPSLNFNLPCFYNLSKESILIFPSHSRPRHLLVSICIDLSSRAYATL